MTDSAKADKPVAKGVKRVKKKDGKKPKRELSEGALKLRALVEQAAKAAASVEAATAASSKVRDDRDSSPAAPATVVDRAAGERKETDGKGHRTKGKPAGIKRKPRVGPKEYVDHPNVVFVGNVPLSVDKPQLIKRLGIDPSIVKSIHFRSLPVESKFATNKRIGVIRGMLSDAKSSQNAYITLVDEKYVDEVVQKNTMELDGHYLFINKTSPSSFSKFNRKKTVFVGRLPPKTTENELFDVFSNISPVKGVRIIRDPKTSESKGFGFVAFDTRTAVPEAIAAFNNQPFKGYTLHVMKALDHEAASERKAKAPGKKGARSGGKVGAKSANNKRGKAPPKRTIKPKKKSKGR
ncbi:RNA recognition motif-containing protein [Babesia caballi]|uniref:RNA recognition motif-containing protein n=1 Tax=Babesia caballi TaxID=5871 RepID=A0AAV4LM67_BABCB|nr:RNA recognition motif-containing protein [Babesia caballi]